MESINVTELMGLTSQEIRILSMLPKLAEEAHEAAELIEKSYETSFGLKNKKIEVFRTESCGEYYGYGYLTIDGKFEYTDNWGGGGAFEVFVDEEGIYQFLRSAYLRENKLDHIDPTPGYIRNISKPERFFREWIDTLRE